MNELGIDPNLARDWFPISKTEPYILIRVPEADAEGWKHGLRDAVRRCYISDTSLMTRAGQLAAQLQTTLNECQAQIVGAKLPDPGATMAGDFGEILIYIFQASNALPRATIGVKKWRLKQDRTKPAPKSDVVHFILPTWPAPSENDEILCAEVKLKSSAGTSTPIADAIDDAKKDCVSRLSSTLEWLKERALGEDLGEITIAHLNRFIEAIDHPVVKKSFRAVAVVCADLIDNELKSAPDEAPPDCELVVVAVPNLHAVYNAAFEIAKASTVPIVP